MVSRACVASVLVFVVLVLGPAGCKPPSAGRGGPGEDNGQPDTPPGARTPAPAESSGGPAADTITLAVGLTVEPYVIKPEAPEDGRSGFEVDIVREALALKGYTAAFVFEPLQRTKSSFQQGRTDAVMTIKEDYPEIQGAFLSNEYIVYHNLAVTLESRNWAIDTIADLQDKSVIAYQQASIALGDAFGAMARKNPHYSEMADQEKQIAMFFLGRVDAIVLDIHIFKYYRRRLPNVPTERAVVFHELFDESRYRIAFKDAGARDAFNSGLKALRASGRYQEIIDSYIAE